MMEGQDEMLEGQYRLHDDFKASGRYPVKLDGLLQAYESTESQASTEFVKLPSAR